MSETVDGRILCVLRFLDGETGLPVAGALEVSGPGVRIVRNRSGLYVLTGAPGFEAYAGSFEAPPSPAPSSVELTVRDPGGRHLPRRFQLTLPSPSTSAPFAPEDVRLYLSSNARPSPGSAVVRLSVRDAGGAPQPWALLSVSVALPDGPALQARGLSDARGEALVLVPGIPLLRWGQDAGQSLIDTSFTATLRAAVVPAVDGLPLPEEPPGGLTPLPDTFSVASSQELHRPIHLSTT
jgi:hypothetical protein